MCYLDSNLKWCSEHSLSLSINKIRDGEIKRHGETHSYALHDWAKEDKTD